MLGLILYSTIKKWSNARPHFVFHNQQANKNKQTKKGGGAKLGLVLHSTIKRPKKRGAMLGLVVGQVVRNNFFLPIMRNWPCKQHDTNIYFFLAQLWFYFFFTLGRLESVLYGRVGGRERVIFVSEERTFQ